MGDVIRFPIDHETKGTTGRDGYLIAEALCFAIKWIDYLPTEQRLESDKLDMLRILNTGFPEWEDTFGPP